MLPPKRHSRSLTPLQPLPKKTRNISIQNDECTKPYKLTPTSKASILNTSTSKTSSSKASSSKAFFSRTLIPLRYDDNNTDNIPETSNSNDIIDLLQAEKDTLDNNL
ncbi:14735_t:CDS:1 [Funneliformis geosporum]|nr:14735_t:CDS:1 [Funneliformis geosporum]